MLNSQSVLRNDVTLYCLARYVWRLFWVEFCVFLYNLGPRRFLMWNSLGPQPIRQKMAKFGCRMFFNFNILCVHILTLQVMFYGKIIDDFRGACAVKGNVQVAGRTSSVSTTEMLSTHDVTLRNVDGSLFHVQIWIVMGHQDQNGQNWRNISQFTMRLSQSSVNVYKNLSIFIPMSALCCQMWQRYG